MDKKTTSFVCATSQYPYDATLRAAREALSGPCERDGVTKALVGLGQMMCICYTLSKRAGWWNGIDPADPYVFGTKIALIHSEVTEAMEGGRKGLMDDHLPHRPMEEVELADAIIRILDLAGARGLDVEGAVIEKLAYNMQRPDHKIDVRAEAGGKKF